MSDSDFQAAIDAATAYEGLHVPALFGPWAPRVAAAAGAGPDDRVLDVACGTGVLARAALEDVRAPDQVAGVDPDPGMLAVAERLAPGVDFRRGTADAIPFGDATFDRVVSQFGMMFFPDREAALTEMVRVLAPGGMLVVAVWDGLDNTPAYAAEVALLDRVAGAAAADALRAPFVLGDRANLESLFEAAGLANVAGETHPGPARFPSVRRMVEADLRGWLPIMGVVLPEEVIERLLAEAEVALAPWVTPEGTVAFQSPGHIVTGRKG